MTEKRAAQLNELASIASVGENGVVARPSQEIDKRSVTSLRSATYWVSYGAGGEAMSLEELVVFAEMVLTRIGQRNMDKALARNGFRGPHVTDHSIDLNPSDERILVFALQINFLDPELLN